ncbi:Transcription factor, fungi [Ophiocordyceps sinensis CO18]|uniref:Transcription factor, fungi n=1 Tax=Ophiocordyceps sinensis (strain Co18 / CGMCC 3.14243) TaxID=911162 RepID=T5AEF1_OPHSC|nr:Transcription factor, fungi [Ophiocordyceps sinensis CO18]
MPAARQSPRCLDLPCAAAGRQHAHPQRPQCDGNRPVCERCARTGSGCVYTQGGHDKRMERQEERRANLVLAGRVKELEARLAAATARQSPDSTPRDRPADPDVSVADAGADAGTDAGAPGPPPIDIGYFGSSSNHAFFWSLSASIENVSHRGPCRYQEPLSRQGPGPDDDSRRPGEPPAVTTASHDTAPVPPPAAPDDDSFPGAHLAVEWTARFFDTVGAVLPYVGESDVLREVDEIDARGQGWLSAARSTQALLSIVFAQALYTMGGERSPEPFYRRALSLLDDKTVYIPTVDALQALLLLASFQQNTQRSMESWAPHYRAVRVSYQLGIHAPASYDHLAVEEKEIRSRLWFAVVNQDRILTAGLARPCLIPLQHLRMELAEFLGPQNRTADMSRPKESLVYFRHVIALHEIMGITVDSLYSANISSSSRLALGDLMAKTIDLSWRLEQWRESAAPPGIVSAEADFGTWTAAGFEAERYAILLSIFHYRTTMLLHGSLLMRVLERVTRSGQDASSGVLQDAGLSLLGNYLRALRDWLRLINGILRHGRSFLNRNAVWWTSNYMMLSTCIHAFAFWLLSANLGSSMDVLSVNTNDVEALLRGSLETLKLLGGTSIISRKAHRCLHRYLRFLKSMRAPIGSANPSDADAGAAPAPVPDAGRPPPEPGDGGLPPANPQFLPWAPANPAGEGLSVEIGNDVIATCIDDMFGSLGHDDFMNIDFLGPEHAISDFDACGFI